MELFKQIEDAREHLRGQALETPVMTSSTLNERLNAKVFFKCENFQKGGAFKFRGVYNALSQLSDAERDHGVITHSSGNHAQAVALVGRLLGIATTVVMPADAPAIKRAATQEYGAEIVLYDPKTTTREALSHSLQQQHGYTMIPPFDHADIIAGQGTAAVELIEAVESLDLVLVPCGGGGLLSGTAIALKHLCPGCRVVGIEPELADDAARSFRTQQLHTISNPPTIADGTRTASLGQLTFPLVLEYVDDMQTVSEAAIAAAVQYLFYRMKLVVEPSGALGLAALLSRNIESRGRIGVILSGGNVDGTTLYHLLGA
ncbi:MAG: threo-3-hydroxy-L-aspartate ammonia-lyase [Cyanophyceae cyanobacterium]